MLETCQLKQLHDQMLSEMHLSCKNKFENSKSKIVTAPNTARQLGGYLSYNQIPEVADYTMKVLVGQRRQRTQFFRPSAGAAGSLVGELEKKISCELQVNKKKFSPIGLNLEMHGKDCHFQIEVEKI